PCPLLGVIPLCAWRIRLSGRVVVEGSFPKADIHRHDHNVRFVPKTDIDCLFRSSRLASHSRRASARAKNASGTTRPTVFALLRLTASSNFVGCSMGRSLGVSTC